MTYADNYNIRTTSVKFNDVADALDGLITRNYAGITTGTSTTYIATPTPAWDAYTTSGLVVIIPHVTNTGAATLNISGLGARDLKIGNAAIAAGVLQQNIPTILAYTGTYFEVLLQNVSIPIGTIYTYAGASAPAGYLLCDGSSQSTTGSYAALYGVIGYTYGGSGASFNVPDLRRRVPIGKGASDTLGGNDGVAYASRSATQSHSVPAHYHGMGTGATLAVDISHTHSSSSLTIETTGSGHGHGFSLSADSAGAHAHWMASSGSGNTRFGAGYTNATTNTTIFGAVTGGTAAGTTTTTDGTHGHNISGTIGSADGTHTHTGTAAGQTLTTTNKTPTGTIGLVTGGVDGNAAMTSGAGQYLYINYIIKT
jgi:microcystin-dependent protein